jgi:hypothetical protein
VVVVGAAAAVRIADAVAGWAAPATTFIAGAEAFARLADKVALWGGIGVAKVATRATVLAVGLEVNTLLLASYRAQGEG